MNKVLFAGTGAASVAYCTAGIFGYATFAWRINGEGGEPTAKEIYDA